MFIFVVYFGRKEQFGKCGLDGDAYATMDKVSEYYVTVIEVPIMKLYFVSQINILLKKRSIIAGEEQLNG